MKRILKDQSAFFNLRALTGAFIVLSGVFLALLGFGAFPASPGVSAKAQQSRNAQDQGPNAKLPVSQPVPAELICEDDGICVQTYAGFDNDLTRFLARQDNTIRPVDTTKKNRLINTIKNFAGTVGVPRQAIHHQADGRWYGNSVIDGEIDAYYKQGAEPELRSCAVVKARKTTRYRTPVAPISDDQLKLIADQSIAQWHVPILAPREQLLFADYIHTRSVIDNTEPMVITERVGYYRMFPGRQVANSVLTVEVDPSTSNAVGLSLRAFWPVLPPQTTALKTFDVLKSDALKALHKNGSREWTLNVTACTPTYYQTPAALIPSLSCSGEFIDANGAPKDDTEGVFVDVSLATSYSLDESDEMSVFTSTYSDDTDGGGPQPRPDSCAERSGFAFHAYYITENDRFYDGAKEFYDKFDNSSREANLGKAWHDSRFVVTPCDQDGADWSDLIYLASHGNVQLVQAENDDPLKFIYTTQRDPEHTSDITELGKGDAEYLLHTGCLTASAVYCDGETAKSRYTQPTIGAHSVFNGLHIFSGHNGLSYSNSSIQKDLAKTLSEYLNDPLTIIEAWEDTCDEVRTWLSNQKDGCSKMTDPDNSCSWESFDCSRFTAYASSFYQDGKLDVTLSNRGKYSDDIHPGEPDYKIDIQYETESDTIPIYAPGHSLP